MKNEKNNQEKSNTAIKLKQTTAGAAFAAVIFAATFLAHIPVPMTNGYVHLGDAFIFIAASLLPPFLSVPAAIIGASLADLLGGFPIYIPATVVIKAATVLCFTHRKRKLLCLHNLIALAAAVVLCAGGYYLYEAVVIYKNYAGPAVNIPANMLQAGVSALILILFAAAVDRTPRLRTFFK